MSEYYVVMNRWGIADILCVSDDPSPLILDWTDEDEFIPTEPELIEQLKPGPKGAETPEEYQQRVWEAIEAAAKG